MGYSFLPILFVFFFEPYCSGPYHSGAQPENGRGPQLRPAAILCGYRRPSRAACMGKIRSLRAAGCAPLHLEIFRLYSFGGVGTKTENLNFGNSFIFACCEFNFLRTSTFLRLIAQIIFISENNDSISKKLAFG